jgi:hypothetical protein
MGEAVTRHSLSPLNPREDGLLAKLGRIARAENADMRLLCDKLESE